MRKASLILATALASLALAAPAMAKETTLTLYSPPIKTLPYVHDTHTLRLQPNGTEAPAKPGYVTGVKEQVLVDSKDPDAKPLGNARMMIHHLLYFAPGRVEDSEGSCWGPQEIGPNRIKIPGSGFITGRGEEHPEGNFDFAPPETRARYGIANRMPDGSAPSWLLVAMVMNHVKKPKTVYVRTKVHYTEEERQPIYPTVVGCRPNNMAYDVPGGGGPGAVHADESTWVAPYSGRIMVGASHQHGGGRHQTLSSDTCRRRIYRANVYHGTEDHIYNTIRPILHEPGPIANGTFASLTGVPVKAGEVLRRKAVHDNANLHVAAMGFWVLHMIKDESVGDCDPMPTDIRELRKPKRYDRTPNYALKVPQLSKPTGSFKAFAGGPLPVADDYFKPEKLTVPAGQELTWDFRGSKPHTVTVANGPRGFSSLYSGQVRGEFKFTPTVPGTYRLTCLVHPTTMGQTLKVR
jgi:hypothetical protein